MLWKVVEESSVPDHGIFYPYQYQVIRTSGFFRGCYMPTKIFLKKFLLIAYYRYIKVFLNFLFLLMERSGSVQIISDPDPGGQKT
jgi:hypothetical protein